MSKKEALPKRFTCKCGKRGNASLGGTMCEYCVEAGEISRWIYDVIEAVVLE